MDRPVLLPEIVKEEVQMQIGLPRDASGEWTITFTCRRTCLFVDRNDVEGAVDTVSDEAE